MKVALVHDWLNQYGGAEVVLEAIHDMYPEAPVYTSIYDRSVMPASFKGWDIRTSFIQSLPFVRRGFRALLPLYPVAFEQFDLRGYDLVLSSSSSWAKGVITTPETVHVCYCHAPMRYCWDVYYDEVIRRKRLLRGPLAATIFLLRMWDVDGANRVDRFVANSGFVAAKIRKYYRREATVVYPPVDTDFFRPSGERADYFLVISRLRPYKRIDLGCTSVQSLGSAFEDCGHWRGDKTPAADGRQQHRISRVRPAAGAPRSRGGLQGSRRSRQRGLRLGPSGSHGHWPSRDRLCSRRSVGDRG